MKKENCDIHFIQKTQRTIDRMKISSGKFWTKYNFVDIEAIILIGGIITLWNPKMVHVVSFEATQYSMYLVLHYFSSPNPIICTNVYGPQLIDEKLHLMIHPIDYGVNPAEFFDEPLFVLGSINV